MSFRFDVHAEGKLLELAYSFQSRSLLSPAIFFRSVRSCVTSIVPRYFPFLFLTAKYRMWTALVHRDPEFGCVLFAGREGFNDFVNYVNAFLRVAQLHAPADD